MQDMSEDLVKERSQKVISILSDPNAVTTSGLTNCTNLLLNTVEYNNYQLAAKNKDLVYSAFSVILKSDFYKMLPINLTNHVIDTLKKIAINRQSLLSIGEPDTPFIDPNGNDFFRVLVKNDYIASYENTEINAASTDLEINYATSVSYVTLLKSSSINNDTNSLSQSLGLYILQYSRDFVGIRSYLTSNFPNTEKNWSYIFFSYELPSSGQNQNNEKNITAILSIDTNKGVNFTTGYESVIQGNLVCDASISSQVIKCPLQSFNIDCDGTTGYVSYNCSSYSRIPTCDILKTESSNAVCDLESYTNEYVNCKCTSSISSNSNSVNFPVVSHTMAKYTSFSTLKYPTPMILETVIISFKLKGISRDLFTKDLNNLNRILKESLSITLHIPVATIKDLILEEIVGAMKKQLAQYINLLQVILLNVKFVVVSGYSSGQIIQNFNPSIFTKSLSTKAAG
jgi:hypothetical protein